MDSITRNLVSKTVSTKKLMYTAFTTLPTELQLEILEYIPRKLVFQPNELVFLKHFYMFFFCYHLGDESWMTDSKKFFYFWKYIESQMDDSDYDDHVEDSCIDTFFELVPDDLRKSRPFMNMLIQKNPKVQEYVIEPMTDRECESMVFTKKQIDCYQKFVLTALKVGCDDVVSEEMKNDREFMLTAVQQKSGTLLYASDELQNDREMVLAAVKQDGNFLHYVSRELQNDFEIALAAVQQNGYALGSIACKLYKNREIVLAAVKQVGKALKYASNELKNDREIVLVAIKQDRKYLQYASKELKNDRELLSYAKKN